MSDPYAIRDGGAEVAESAVVIALRQRNGAWEVLLHDSEVINWLKSTPVKLVPMRYGGEWRMPGGNLDPGEEPEEAARREIEEEMLAETPGLKKLPPSAILRPFTVRQTRPIRSRSNMIYYYIALEDENPWLQGFDVAVANEGLTQRRKRFTQIFLSKRWGTLPLHEKETISPETHSFAWMELNAASKLILSAHIPGTWASDFQRKEYELWGVTRQRDPPFLTAVILRMIAPFRTREALLKRLAEVGDVKALAKEVQWIFPGMNKEEVDAKLEQNRLNDGRKATENLVKSKL